MLFLDPGSEIRDPGWVKIRIRDKHPGSATLLVGDLGSMPLKKKITKNKKMQFGPKPYITGRLSSKASPLQQKACQAWELFVSFLADRFSILE